MKYKVGDKVKVRQDLMDNEKCGANKWFFNMHRKYIVIDKVYEDCYVAYNNGTNWYYTEEMLDGLVDEPEKPTDAELIQAAEMLKANCEKIDGCRGCVFTKHGLCGITHCLPHKWEIPHHRKTRKELLLEKFPNIRVDACGIPCLNPCEMDPIYSNNNCLGKWEHDCASCRKGYWNAPAESEEE